MSITLAGAVTISQKPVFGSSGRYVGDTFEESPIVLFDVQLGGVLMTVFSEKPSVVQFIKDNNYRVGDSLVVAGLLDVSSYIRNDGYYGVSLRLDATTVSQITTVDINIRGSNPSSDDQAYLDNTRESVAS
ncbi:hypothetical protein GGI12_005990 [Dipsacomyces acuminosporus]|nr:hypothetical protein GGI12_005990 [Dipsacomyces acuminosporus]